MMTSPASYGCAPTSNHHLARRSLDALNMLESLTTDEQGVSLARDPKAGLYVVRVTRWDSPDAPATFRAATALEAIELAHKWTR